MHHTTDVPPIPRHEPTTGRSKRFLIPKCFLRKRVIISAVAVICFAVAGTVWSVLGSGEVSQHDAAQCVNRKLHERINTTTYDDSVSALAAITKCTDGGSEIRAGKYADHLVTAYDLAAAIDEFSKFKVGESTYTWRKEFAKVSDSYEVAAKKLGLSRSYSH